MKTHIYNDGVGIRWTPKNLYLWRKWSKNGYRIERSMIGRNGEAIDVGENILLGGKSILPLKEEEWKEYAKLWPEANLIQYCMSKDTNRKIISKPDYFSAQEEDDQCYIFSMLTMQAKFDLAIAGGIGFIDKTTIKDAIYLYKLFPVNGQRNDTQIFIVNMQETTSLPIINGFSSHLKDNRIQLEWNASIYHSTYFGFQIERSNDGGSNFFPINDKPILPTISEAGIQNKIELFVDTVCQYYQPIYYRIKGLSYFGQYSLPSITTSIIAFPETSEFPKFLEVENNSINSSKISWHFDTTNESLIKGFKILISDSSEGLFEAMDSTLIDSKRRTIEWRTDKEITYIKVAAISLNNTFNESFPLMIQLVDSFAPLPPQMLSLSIDTNGISTLHWKANQEKDFLAYLVYKGNDRYQEFSSITPQYYKDTIIRDTLFNKMLRDSIYYKITALDNRYNESGYSVIMASGIPDKIPPAPPYLYEITSDNKHALIRWHKSNSNDISHYKLIREHMHTNDIQITIINKDSSDYCDSSVMQDVNYNYSLLAVDYSGFESKKTNPYTTRIPSEKLMPGVILNSIITDTSRHSVSFFWNYQFDDDVTHYRILQNQPDGNIKTIGTAEAGKNFYTYYYLKPYTMTTYYIIAYFKDGRRSKL